MNRHPVWRTYEPIHVPFAATPYPPDMVDLWQPMGLRQGWWADDAPYEGIPDHLRRPLEDWARRYLGGEHNRGMSRDPVIERNLSAIASRLRLTVDASNHLHNGLIQTMDHNPERFLEIVDMSLWLTPGVGGHELAMELDVGGSVWAVAHDHRGLERRVTATEKEAYVAAVRPNDEASDHLKQAWQKIYGIHLTRLTRGTTRSRQSRPCFGISSYRRTTRPRSARF